MKDRTGQPHALTGCPSRDLLEAHAFAAEGLSPLQREQVVDHLAVCPVCAETYLSLCQLEEQVLADTPEASAGTMPAESATSDEQIFEGVWKYMAAEEIVTGSRRTHWLPQRRALVAVAASVLMALGLAVGWYASYGSRGGSPVAVQAAGPDVAGRTDLSREAVWAESPIVLAEPAPFDLDKVDYEKWRDEHREWFAATFPWIPDIQEELRSRGTTVDYIGLLMVSGDIWQFHYGPHLAAAHPLTEAEPLAVIRLARHYALNERELARAVGLSDISSAASMPTKGPAPGQQYAAALRRWHTALTVNGQQTAGSAHELMWFSLRASQYFANTRTAVYLWAKTYPKQAKRLLAGDEYRDILPAGLMAMDEEQWLKQLHRQAVVGARCRQVAMEWFAMPNGAECLPRSTALRKKLAALLSELMADGPDSVSTARGNLVLVCPCL